MDPKLPHTIEEIVSNMEQVHGEAIERMLNVMEGQQKQIEALDQHHAVLRDKLHAVCLIVGALNNAPDGSLRDRVHALEVINGMDPADHEILKATDWK